MPSNEACALAHEQIFTGSCPWCDEEVSMFDNLPQIAVARTRKCQWNVTAIERALDSGDESACAATVSNLVGADGPELEMVLPLLQKALQAPSPVVRTHAVRAAVKMGETLSAEDARSLMRGIFESPAGLSVKSLLVASRLLCNDLDFGDCVDPDGGDREWMVRDPF
ncbi:hypothetical protein Pla123a_37210 [Posidoniimonas polymericola]|uniref:HEAT repeat protein n=1 Tax=Posidoniimonas polymericola TaxID=2528002 RepID=A0A5C5YDL2_9BACT|nr:HEAT repeat domain-containing protein [Posidoniimonas polymericola]TWT73827.1 hypothetical protein Pla123a_37210 [Posidoniimonas polymericola]